MDALDVLATNARYKDRCKEIFETILAIHPHNVR
jgi:hypothetical protein